MAWPARGRSRPRPVGGGSTPPHRRLDNGLQRREFALLRYPIVHSVADARPVVRLVIAPDDTPPADTWVQAEGVLSRRDYRGGRLITTTADRILPTAEPQEPDLRAGF